MHFGDSFSLDMSQISSSLFKKTVATLQYTFLSKGTTFRHFCLGMHRKWSLVFFVFCFHFFLFTFSYLFAAVITLTFFWACFHLKDFLESIFDEENSSYGAVSVVEGNLALNFSLKFLGIFMYISDSIDPITLIWVSLELSFPPPEHNYKWCQFGQKWCQKWKKCDACHSQVLLAQVSMG